MVRALRIFTIAALTATLLGSAAAYAQGPGPGGFRGRGPGGPGGPGGGMPLRQLNLTEAQQQQVRQLMQRHREQTRSLMERLHTAHAARFQATETLPVNEAAIRATTQELVEVETDMTVHRARLQSDIHALLTPEQQQRLQQLRADRQAHMKQRRERMQQRFQRRRG